MSQKAAKATRKAEAIELEERRKRMQFTARQRLVLLATMPQEAGYFNIQKIREVRETLGFSDSEQKVFEGSTTVIPGATITNWKEVDKQIPPKRVDVGEWLTNYFRTELKKQYDEEKLREDTIDLYDTFCGPPQK